MTDTPLLRMARIVAHLTWNTYADGDARTAEAEQLVRDLEAAPFPRADEAETRRAADLLISHFGGYSLPDAVEKAVAVRYMKREEGIIPPWEMLVPPPPARRTITREEFHRGIETIRGLHGVSNKEVAYAIAAAWRLTVED